LRPQSFIPDRRFAGGAVVKSARLAERVGESADHLAPWGLNHRNARLKARTLLAADERRSSKRVLIGVHRRLKYLFFLRPNHSVLTEEFAGVAVVNPARQLKMP
jgi:hypothetical protein